MMRVRQTEVDSNLVPPDDTLATLPKVRISCTLLVNFNPRIDY
jgi:hypothetical protein